MRLLALVDCIVLVAFDWFVVHVSLRLVLVGLNVLYNFLQLLTFCDVVNQKFGQCQPSQCCFREVPTLHPWRSQRAPCLMLVELPEVLIFVSLWPHVGC